MRGIFFKKGEIATIIAIGTVIILGVTSLISSLLLSRTKQSSQTKAAGCVVVQSVNDPGEVASGQSFTCSGQVDQANSTTVACGWSKNGGWPQTGGAGTGTCNGTTCTFPIKMDSYSEGTADQYSLVMFDFSSSCGPSTGKSISLTIKKPAATPTSPPNCDAECCGKPDGYTYKSALKEACDGGLGKYVIIDGVCQGGKKSEKPGCATCNSCSSGAADIAPVPGNDLSKNACTPGGCGGSSSSSGGGSSSSSSSSGSGSSSSSGGTGGGGTFVENGKIVTYSACREWKNGWGSQDGLRCDGKWSENGPCACLGGTPGCNGATSSQCCHQNGGNMPNYCEVSGKAGFYYTSEIVSIADPTPTQKKSSSSSSKNSGSSSSSKSSSSSVSCSCDGGTCSAGCSNSGYDCFFDPDACIAKSSSSSSLSSSSGSSSSATGGSSSSSGASTSSSSSSSSVAINLCVIDRCPNPNEAVEVWTKCLAAGVGDSCVSKQYFTKESDCRANQNSFDPGLDPRVFPSYCDRKIRHLRLIVNLQIKTTITDMHSTPWLEAKLKLNPIQVLANKPIPDFSSDYTNHLIVDVASGRESLVWPEYYVNFCYWGNLPGIPRCISSAETLVYPGGEEPTLNYTIVVK